MERHVLLNLRVATKEDFADEFGNKIIGVPYFEQSSTGVVQPTIKYFTENIDMQNFKELYACNQIFVMVNPNEAKSTFNCIDWELVDRELDFEINKLEKLSINQKQ